MKKKLFYLTLLSPLAGLLLSPSFALAHQPRIVDTPFTNITSPEISKAYYDELNGEPQVYLINSETKFRLYVNILVPDIPGQKRDVSAVVIRRADPGNPITILDGENFDWQPLFEPYGYDHYLKGPEASRNLPPGSYEIRVWSSNNDSKYSLAVGDIEFFDMNEGLKAIAVIPYLKRTFFNESPISFILSPFGYGYIAGIFTLSFIFGFIFHFVMRLIGRRSKRGLRKNIGTKDRLIRLGIAIIFFSGAITTTWNPLLLFISGFCLFEAIFKWCGFYALIGKNTCPA